MGWRSWRRPGCWVLMALGCLTASRPAAGAGLPKEYEGTYFKFTTDFDEVNTRDFIFRLDRLVPYYNEHFPALRGAVTRKYEVHLFKDGDAFFESGAPRVNVTRGYHAGLHKTFVLDDGEKTSGAELQGLCFQQFCNESVLNDNVALPPWLSVGTQRYFRLAAFTGDGYECELMPVHRLEELQDLLTGGEFRPTAELLNLSREDPKARPIDDVDVPHAWSLVYFLDNGDGGRHRDKFARYTRDVARGITHKEAWRTAFGDWDVDAAWRAWAKALRPEDSRDQFARVVAVSLASFLGRAAAAGQTFESADELFAALKRRDGVKFASDADWVPRSHALVTSNDYLKLAGPDVRFEIGVTNGRPTVTATAPGRAKIVATYDRSRAGTPGAVDVEVPGRAKRSPAAVPKFLSAPATVVVESARFGIEGDWVDVTEKCRKLVVGDMILAPRGLAEALGADPASGIGFNSLDLRLVVNGARVRVTIADNKKSAPFRLTTTLPLEAGGGDEGTEKKEGEK